MARDLDLLTVRNKSMLADFNRFKAQEYSVKIDGAKLFVRLTYAQILSVLSQKYFLSTKRVEAVLALIQEQHPNTLRAEEHARNIAKA